MNIFANLTLMKIKAWQKLQKNFIALRQQFFIIFEDVKYPVKRIATMKQRKHREKPVEKLELFQKEGSFLKLKSKEYQKLKKEKENV